MNDLQSTISHLTIQPFNKQTYKIAGKKKPRGCGAFRVKMMSLIYELELHAFHVNRVNSFLAFLGFEFNFVVLLYLGAIQASYVYKKVFFGVVVSNEAVNF